MQIVSEKKVIYFLICLGCITVSFNVAAITAAIPVISLDLKLPAIQVSKVIPFYMIPYGIGALIYAPLTRKISYRAVLAGTLALFSIACFACGISNDLNSFLLARIAMGVTGASTIPLGLMLIGELFDRNVRGRLVGLFFGCSFFSSLAGIVLSGLANWRWLFYVPAIIAALSSACFFILKSQCLKRVNSSSVNYFKAFSDVKIRNVFIFIFAISFFYHGVHKWFGIYLDKAYGMDKLTISFFFILGAIGGVAGHLLGGYISDKKGRLISCYIGII
ncbi:MAG: MFS transporter, partial [Candidatus Omnitrophica bacterium]|nr:MFS transporter [Candidatus Omnitrophota bacterium]